MPKGYYIDTCIWLNLFKKEGNPSKGKPYWEIAEEFIEKIKSDEEIKILCSIFIIREIESKLGDKEMFKEKRDFIKNEVKAEFVNATKEDYNLARKLESESGYEVSFYDCLYIAMCRRGGFVLVTRDRKLIEFAKKYISVSKPEDLIL